MDRFLRINARLAIPLDEVVLRASRAGGPGGQHVNRTSTRIEAVWNLHRSPSLSADDRARLLARLGNRIDAEGDVRVVASEHRSQLRNREAALERLAGLVARALTVPRARKKTRPTRASKERRLTEKKRRGATKRDRRRPPGDD